MIIELAWRNLWRRPVRTVLSLVTIALAAALLVFMLSFQLGVYDTMKISALKRFDGLAQIQPKGYAGDPDIRKAISSPDPLIKQTLSIPGIRAASPRAVSYAILANGDLSYGAAIAGIDPDKDRHVSTLRDSIDQGRYLQTSDKDTIVMGAALARNLKVSVGDRITMLGSAMDGTVAADSLKLVGTFKSGIQELDRQLAEMPLARFQGSFAMGNRVNVIAVSGDALASVDHALPELTKTAALKGLVVRNWGELQPALKQAIALDFSSSMFFYISLVIVVVFIILNTLLMSVLERTREFGMLMAIGMQPGLAAGMLWIELMELALLGITIGLALGGGLTLWLEHAGIAVGATEGLLTQWGIPGKLYPALTLASALAGPVVILASIGLGGLIPVARLFSLEPVTAMKEG